MIFLKIISMFMVGIGFRFFYGTFALNAEDALLSKFHQNAYKLRNLRADVIHVNKDYLNRFEVRTFKFNRTVTAFNITLSTKIDVGDELDLVGQAYKRYSNEYRLFPMRMRINYCRYFNSNAFGLLNALKCGNVTSCILKKDVVYRICNFLIDETKFPPLVPIGEFKSVFTGMYREIEVSVLEGYAEIYLPMKIQ